MKKTIVYSVVLMMCFSIFYTEKSHATSDNVKDFKSKDLQDYQRAVIKKDLDFLKSRVSRNFRIDRDFGGIFQEDLSPEDNFINALSLDNSQLSPDYKDTGWKRFAVIIQHAITTINALPGEVCTTPKTVNDDFPDVFLSSHSF